MATVGVSNLSHDLGDTVAGLVIATDTEAVSVNAFNTWIVEGLPPGIVADSLTPGQTVHGSGAFPPRTLNPLRVSGTFTAPGTYSVTVRGQWLVGRTRSATFTWTVTDPVPVAPNIADKRNNIGDAVNVQLPAGSGGNAPLTYSVSGLPSGLSFNRNTRRVTGSPSRRGGEAPVVTYTVRDATGDEASETFTWTIVDLVPSLPDIANKLNKVGDAVNVELPAGSSGTQPLTYSATGLPSGLIFDENTRRVTGAPTTQQIATVTYRVRDANGDTAEKSFIWTITENPVPVLPTISDKTVEIGRDVDLQLPPASGGDAPVRYTLTGLPAGLAFDANTRRISGSLPAAGTHPVTYTATDVEGDAVQEIFRIVVIAAAVPVNLESIVRDLALLCGFQDSEIDVSQVEGAVTGYILSDVHTGESAVSQVADLFRLDVAEADGVVRVVTRGTAADAFVEQGAMLSRGADELPYTLSRVPDVSLPVRMRLTALASGTDIELTAATPRRISRPTPTVDSRVEDHIRIPASMDVADLADLSTDLLHRRWSERTTLSFRLPPRFMRLTPGDIVEIRLDGDFVIACAIRETTLAIDWQMELVVVSIEPGRFEA